jgi:hypothetical protein
MRLPRCCGRPATKSGGDRDVGQRVAYCQVSVRNHPAPVLPGAGTRLLDDDDGHIRLQPTRIIGSSKAAHHRYRVLTADGTG